MNSSHTEQEMSDSVDVCRRFDFTLPPEIFPLLSCRRLLFTGMGSSVLFPGFQAKNRALHLGLRLPPDAAIASDLFQFTDFTGTLVCLCSNSGQTKETIQLLTHVQAHGGTCLAITAVADSVLAKHSDHCILLQGGFEKGVAATKSVIEQGLIYDAMIFALAKKQGLPVDFNQLKQDLNAAAPMLQTNLDLVWPQKIIQTLAQAQTLYWVGLDTGVAAELALKTHEINRQPAVYFPDTHILHGPAEAISDSAVIIVEAGALANFMGEFDQFSQKTNSPVIRLDANPEYSDLPLQSQPTFKHYTYLAAGWSLLRALAHHRHIDIDHPQKINKVGNPI